jgi:hypothetical protein
MAKRGTRGADFKARDRDLIRPRFTSSCAALFEERGNPWLSDRDQRTDFSASHSRPASGPSQYEMDAALRVNRLRKALGMTELPIEPVLPSFHVDPDMDQFTKAELVKAKPEFIDPKGEPTIRDHDRWRANLMRRTRERIAAMTIEPIDKLTRPQKVRGSFYRFPDVQRPIEDQTPYEAIKKSGGRPFFGVPAKGKK